MSHVEPVGMPRVEFEGPMGMPRVEFEGPMGTFWSMEEVPFEALTKGIAEIVQELLRRGYREGMFLEAIKREIGKLRPNDKEAK